MKKLIVALAMGFALAGVGVGASGAEAASSFCKQRYNVCLARCPERLTCDRRCRVQYKYCINPYPYLGALL